MPDRAGGPRHLRGVAVRRGGRGSRSGCPHAATSGRCWRRSPATPRRSSPATACAGPATTTPAAGRSTSCRSTSACPRRRCASSATTWPTSRAPTTSARWWWSRTACRTSASTAGSRSTCRATTTTRRWRRCSPAGSRRYLDERDRPPAERGDEPGKFAYPPQLLVVDGGKGQLGVAERVVRELGLERRDPGGRAGQAVRGGVRARPVRAGGHAAGERGAVPAAAHPRRGPPLRQHVPPRAAQQADDDAACSTASPGSARRAQKRLRQGARRRQRRQARRPRRPAGADVAPRRRGRGRLRQDPPAAAHGRRHASGWRPGDAGRR